MRWTATVLVFLSSVCLGLGPARGDEKAEAKKFFDIGIKLQKSADYQGAAEAFEDSIKQYPNKNNLYNLANCYRALNHLKKSLAAFRRIQNEFNETLNKDMRVDIETQIDEIEKSFAKIHIISKPEGAAVTIDGEDAGTTPLREPLSQTAGTHVVAVTLAGYESVSQEIVSTAGEMKEVMFTLTEKKGALTLLVNEADAAVFVDELSVGKAPLASPVLLEKGEHVVKVIKDGFETVEQSVVIAAGGTASLDVTLLKTASASVMVESKPAPSKDKRKRSPLFVVGLAGTATMGVTAGVLWGMTFQKKADYVENNNDLIEMSEQGFWDPNTAEQTNSDKDAVQTFNIAAISASAAAGVFAAVLAAGIGVSHHRKNKETPPKVVFGITRDGVQLRF